MIRVALFLVLFPVMALAQGLPALFDVSNVAADDVLNIRSGPMASASLVGHLPHDASGIEVVETNESGSWGRINIGETSGWLSLRYLARQSGNPDYALTQRFQCFGTEPFWSLSVVQGQSAEFTTPEYQTTIPGAGLLTISRNTPGHYAVGFGNSVAVIRRSSCSDGMSDRAFGLSVDLLLSHGGDSGLYSGCCSLLPN